MTDSASRRPPSEPPRIRSRARRTFHIAIILVLFCVAVAGAAVIGWRMARESPPHQGPIILISVDTLRADGADQVLTWVADGDEARARFLAEAGLAPDGAVREMASGPGPDGGRAVLRERRWFAGI